jgi:two-component system, LytTR family, response regulator
MLKVIAVDDEYISLERLKRILNDISYVELIGTWSDPQQVMAFLKTTNQKIDIAFLDIEMPQINGLQLAEEILINDIQTEVVFLTAHNQYAVEAFKVHASNYLLKPIDIDEIKKCLHYFDQNKQLEKKETNEMIIVDGFGGFQCRIGEDLTIKWRTKKAEELVALLLHYDHIKGVPRERIMEILWPNMESTKASNNLYSNCYYIKKELEKHGIQNFLLRDKDKYFIQIPEEQVDFLFFSMRFDFENYTLEELKEAAKLYNGMYLKGKGYEWAYSKGVWLEKKYADMQLYIAEQQSKCEHLKEAAETLKTLIYYNPCCDEAYKQLIKLWTRLDDLIQAKQYYEQYYTIMKEELGILIEQKAYFD